MDDMTSKPVTMMMKVHCRPIMLHLHCVNDDFSLYKVYMWVIYFMSKLSMSESLHVFQCIRSFYFEARVCMDACRNLRSSRTSGRSVIMLQFRRTQLNIDYAQINNVIDLSLDIMICLLHSVNLY